MIMNRIINKLNILKYRFNPKFIIERQVKIDKSTVLKGHNRICKATKINSSEIGIGTYLGWNCVLINARIGNYCSIGPNVEVVYGRHPLDSFISTHPAFFSINKQAGFTFVNENLFEEYKLVEGRSVIIGNDVWIGNGVKIMEGVTIGDGAVIGAYSVVTKDIEPFSVNVGVPAKKIKYRFNKETIKLIEESKWWYQDPTKLKGKLEDYDLNNFIIERTYDAKN